MTIFAHMINERSVLAGINYVDHIFDYQNLLSLISIPLLRCGYQGIYIKNLYIKNYFVSALCIENCQDSTNFIS